ncbi:MAG: FMN-binding protein [Bacteroidota bacterium]|jgi:Na+-translocating ferredoxin:NAD+ oxidoreductase RnfG subunit
MRFSRHIALVLLLCSGAAVGQSRQQIDALAVSLYGQGSTLRMCKLSLENADVVKLNEVNGARHPWEKVQVYRVEKDGKSVGALLVDDVKGKARPITYGVAFDASGGILALEILAYRESHGGEVQSDTFRRQFEGKTHGDAIAIGRDIRNISGATISSRSVTNGAHALATLRQYLKTNGTLE